MKKQKFLYEYDVKNRKEIWDAVLKDKAFRIKYFEQDLYAFSLYHFWHNFKTWVKDFHRDIYKLCVSKKNWLIIWFRGSWKTSIVALIYIVWCIAYNIEKFILFMAYDVESASDKVMNISNFLKVSKSFVNDYWLLFDDWETLTRDKKIKTSSKPKKMSKFVTTNGIKVESVSLKTMKRWKQLLNDKWEIIRPSLLIADDIDVEWSVENPDIIEKMTMKIESWVMNSIRWRVIFLWNIILNDWIIQRLEKIYWDFWNTMNISLINDWNIIWEEKYKWTKKEADRVNKDKFNWDLVVESIEELAIKLDVFKADYLNIPMWWVWEKVFSYELVNAQEVIEPVKTEYIEIWWDMFELDIFQEHNFNRYIYLSCWLDVAWVWWQIVDYHWNKVEQDEKLMTNDYTDITFLTPDWKLFARVRSKKLWEFNTFKLLKLLTDKYKILYLKNCLVIERNHHWEVLIWNINRSRRDIAKFIYRKLTDNQWRLMYTSKLWYWTDQKSKMDLKDSLRDAMSVVWLQLTKTVKKEFSAWVRQKQGSKFIFTNDKALAKHDDSVISYWLAVMWLVLQWYIDLYPEDI